MKFGDFLENHLVSEWRSQYLDYYRGKTKLKKLAAFLETSTECQCSRGLEQDSREWRYGLSSVGQNRSGHQISAGNLKHQTVNDQHNMDNISIANYQLDRHRGEHEAIVDEEEDGDEDDGEDEDFKIVSLVDKLNAGIRNNENTPLLPSSSSPCHHRSHSTSILYMKGNKQPLTSEDTDITKLAKQQFVDWVDIELLKVDTFYRNKEKDCAKRFVILLEQLHQLKLYEQKSKAGVENSNGEVDNINNDSNDDDDSDNNNDNNDFSCVHHQRRRKRKFLNCKLPIFSTAKILKRVYFIFDYFEMPSLPNYFWKKQINKNADFIDYQISIKKDSAPPLPFISKIMIKKAICELYHKMELLSSFRVINRTAFRKLIKKYDKRCHEKVLISYMQKVDSMHFNSSNLLPTLTQKLEDIFTETFEDGHRKTAITKLRSFEVEKTHYTSNFLSGYLIGISFPFLIFFVVKMIEKSKISHNPIDNFILQLWGSWFLFIWAGLLFAVNCVVWEKYKINYKLVFELNPHDALDYKQFLVIPSGLLCTGSILAYFSCNDLFNSILDFKYFPYIFFYFCLMFLFCPLNVCYLKARIWFIVSIVRLLLSGFYPVEFRDFFMGVITCSLTYSIANIYMLYCLQHLDWNNCVSCGPMKSYVLAVCSCIPGLWRSLQCLRRFLDTGEWFPHFANLAKYLITTSYFFTLGLYRISTFRNLAVDAADSSHKLITSIFIFVSLINSIYSSFWDVCMDWSLMQASSDNYLLRDVLIYKHKIIYYYAIIFDILLRFQWIVYVFTPYSISHSPITAFLVAVAELTRRFVWMFFRMENEHASNVNLFRVSRVCPLPYVFTRNSLIKSSEIKSFVKDELNIDIETLFKSQNQALAMEIMELEDTLNALSPNDIPLNPETSNNISMPQDLESILANRSANDSDALSVYSIATHVTTAKASGWQQLSKIISRAHTKEFQQRENTTNANNFNGDSDLDDELTSTNILNNENMVVDNIDEDDDRSDVNPTCHNGSI